MHNAESSETLPQRTAGKDFQRHLPPDEASQSLLVKIAAQSKAGASFCRCQLSLQPISPSVVPAQYIPLWSQQKVSKLLLMLQHQKLELAKYVGVHE